MFIILKSKKLTWNEALIAFQVEINGYFFVESKPWGIVKLCIQITIRIFSQTLMSLTYNDLGVLDNQECPTFFLFYFDCILYAKCLPKRAGKANIQSFKSGFASKNDLLLPIVL